MHTNICLACLNAKLIRTVFRARAAIPSTRSIHTCQTKCEEATGTGTARKNRMQFRAFGGGNV